MTPAPRRAGSSSRRRPPPSTRWAGGSPTEHGRADGRARVFPVILGFDAAGTVSTVGEDVTRFQTGDRVFGRLLDDPIGYQARGLREVPGGQRAFKE
ncbi:alcohol dehydrogenase catalytic domain-containing protein [Streptomyces sp. NPDC056161]|uniref:alcohol dehydrogenase catalytic domain-containing protein n=1 Tax=Streptomyces sp. NPDC056161 TaxID=3345732 RepID=UPI0035D74982